MSGKGISPLVSAVMLIAFAISIGGIFAEWSGALTDQTTQENTEAQQQILDCSSMKIEIVEITEDYSNNNLNVTLRSDNGAVGNISVRAYPSLEAGFIQLDSAGEVGQISLNVSSQQSSVQAASQECNMDTTQDLDEE